MGVRRIGHEITTINETSVAGMGHDDILQALISGGLELNLETTEGPREDKDYSKLAQVKAPSRVLLMEKAKNESIGLAFVTEGRAVLVSQVVQEGPAWRCGIRVRDQIVGVQGARVSTQEDALERLQTSGRRVSVAVNSHVAASPRERIHFVSKGKKKTPLGMGIVTEDEITTVNVIVPQSPAFNAGIRLGDRITAINGKWPKKPTHKNILKLLVKSASTMSLTVSPLLNLTSKRRMAGSVRYVGGRKATAAKEN